jgi:hypothetical protein
MANAIIVRAASSTARRYRPASSPVLQIPATCVGHPAGTVLASVFLRRDGHLPDPADPAGLLQREAERLDQRIDCLARNRDAIRAYLAAVQQQDPAGPGDRERRYRTASASEVTWSCPDEVGTKMSSSQPADSNAAA